MQKNYMMNANDVADELGVSKVHAYCIYRPDRAHCTAF